LRHEGYLGAIGAFLRGASTYKADDYSWRENMYGSSGFPRQLSEVSSPLKQLRQIQYFTLSVGKDIRGATFGDRSRG